MSTQTRVALAPRKRGRYTVLPDPPEHRDMPQHKHITNADTTLRTRYIDRPDVYVDGECYLCYDTGDLTLYPDCMVAFGVDAEAIDEANGYTISEVGKPPDFVLEVASESTGQRDYTDKRVGYENLGAGEYWRFDYTGGAYHDRPLAGDILVDGRYVDMELREEPGGMIWGHSPALGLDLCWDDGRLRFYDPVAGEYLRSHWESEADREAERQARQVAESEREAAEFEREAERQARQAAEARAEAAEAENRRLRDLLDTLRRQ